MCNFKYFYQVLFTLTYTVLFCVSCNVKADKPSSQNIVSTPYSEIIFVNSTETLNPPTNCYESETNQKFLNCLIANNHNLIDELEIISAKILKKIETQFDSEGDQLDERELESIEHQKEVFTDAINNWSTFSIANCKFLSGNAEDKSSDTFQKCKDDTINERLKELFNYYFISPDDDVRREERNKNYELLEKMPCDETNRGGTLEINQCESQRLRKAEEKLAKRVAEIQLTLSPKDKNVMSSLQKKWSSFVKNNCSAVVTYENPFGTAHTSMYLICVDVATEKRILEFKSFNI